jgi:hypothetical protein
VPQPPSADNIFVAAGTTVGGPILPFSGTVNPDFSPKLALQLSCETKLVFGFVLITHDSPLAR